MFIILRFLILITLTSTGYYLFISEYIDLSDKRFSVIEVPKKGIVADEKIIQEKKEVVKSPNIKKNIDKKQYFEKKI